MNIAAGENRISDAKRRIVENFRTEGQIVAARRLPSVSELGYTVSITDVDGENVEVLTTGPVGKGDLLNYFIRIIIAVCCDSMRRMEIDN